MLPHLRSSFNADFSPARYEAYISALAASAGMPIPFRVSETPFFIGARFERKLFTAAREILEAVSTHAYHRTSDAAFPPGTRAPNEDAHPQCVQVDFAVVADADGQPDIRLIELQGFPSLYGFQEVQGSIARQVLALEQLRHLAPGYTRDAYYDLLARTVCGTHDPAEVVLLEVDPEQQKTRPDFLITERALGIETVDITTVEKRGRELWYTRRDGSRRRIRRIYNRAIIDEIERKHLRLPFAFTDDLDVEWVCHPNWFYRISKFSIPFIHHPTVPETHFLGSLSHIPDDLDDWVLKPLYSFAGGGVKVAPSRAEINAVPVAERDAWLLQRRVIYAPVIATPEGSTKVELRVMFLWDAEPTPVTILVRTGRGAMMGVNFNTGLSWVGSTCCLVDDDE